MPNNKIIDLDRLSRFKDKLDVELEKKANVDGNYPTMTVGSADALTPYGENSGANDTTPFVFQTTGGSSDVGSKAYLRELRGNSVSFSQLISVSTTSQTLNGLTITNNNDGSITISGTATADTTISVGGLILPQNHKYLLKGCPSGGSSSTYYYIDANYPNTRDTGNGVIYTYAYSWTTGTQIKVLNGTNMGTGKVFKPQLFDLTLMFGAGNEPTSVLEFNRLFPKPYYEYNAGTLLSCKVNGIKNVGYNAWGGEFEKGDIDVTTGEDTTDNRFIRGDFIKVIPGQTYSLEQSGTINNDDYGQRNIYEYDENKNFIKRNNQGNKSLHTFDSPYTRTLTDNTHYIRLCYYNRTYTVENVAFHLTWDSSRTGFEEHQEWQYNLPNIELRSAGSAYDVLYSTGGGKRRVGVIDLGSVVWTGTSGYSAYANTIQSLVKRPANYNVLANAICSKYEIVREGEIVSKDKAIAISSIGLILIHDTSLEPFNGVKSDLSGVYLYYELATETDITTEENPGWQNPQDIDDFGTQEFLYDSDIAIPVPQGNEFFYPVDYKAFVDSLGGREDIEYAADQVVSQEQLQTALSTFLSSISGYDATKTQTLKNVNGTFTWVDD